MARASDPRSLAAAGAYNFVVVEACSLTAAGAYNLVVVEGNLAVVPCSLVVVEYNVADQALAVMPGWLPHNWDRQQRCQL